MPEITSESRFLWHIIKDILLTPITLVLIIFGKKKLGDLFKPFSELLKFAFEPKFTIAMIIINIIVFFTSFAFFSEELFDKLLLYPSAVFNLNFLPLITSGFLHANFSHLFGNMLALFIFGRVLERKIGPMKTALVYFGALIISGIFGSLIHYLILNDNTPGLGASGAVMGLVSAAILIDPLYITYELLIPLPVMVVGWLTILADITGILNPVEDGIGHFAHLGGFLSIAILAFLLKIEDREKLKKGLMINAVSILVVALLYVFWLRNLNFRI